MSARASQVKSRASRPSRTPLTLARRSKRGLIKRHSQRRFAPLVIVAVLLVCATVFTVLLEQVILAQTGFKMAQLRERVVAAESRHAELVLRAAKLGSPERIERVAITELGMTYPAPSSVKYIVANVRPNPATKLASARPKFIIDSEAQAVGVSP